MIPPWQCRRAGKTALGVILAALIMATLPASTGAQMTLEIPTEEFEAFDENEYTPIPTVPGSNPAEQFFNYPALDLTGTLPEAVMEQMLGASPMAFSDIGWGLEISGDWSQSLSGTGTLQVFDFTEGLGATGVIDPEQFTDNYGLRSYAARMHMDGSPVFSLAAAFPPDSDADFGGELEGAKGAFYALTLCHMFERHRTGCSDGSDSYYYTDVADTRIHVRQDSGAYSMRFTARVHEFHFESGRDVPGGIRRTPTGRVGLVRGCVMDTAVWEVHSQSCDADDSVDLNARNQDHQNVLEEPQRQLEEALTQAFVQQHLDEVVAQMDAQIAGAMAEITQAEVEWNIQQQQDAAIRQVEAELAQAMAEILQAEEERRLQRLADDRVRQMESELARQQGEISRIHAELAMEAAERRAELERQAAIWRTEEALAQIEEEIDAAGDEDESLEP